jgi:hypothetical protein
MQKENQKEMGTPRKESKKASLLIKKKPFKH